jgi:monofunctional biosynthetic peptidoglycan transglycosylase
LRLKTDEYLDGVAYRQFFTTTNDTWQTINLDFMDFDAVFRGQVLTNHSKIDPGKIQSIGFMISEKQEGSFQLEIASIRAYQ